MTRNAPLCALQMASRDGFLSNPDAIRADYGPGDRAAAGTGQRNVAMECPTNAGRRHCATKSYTLWLTSLETETCSYFYVSVL